MAGVKLCYGWCCRDVGFEKTTSHIGPTLSLEQEKSANLVPTHFILLPQNLEFRARTIEALVTVRK